MEKLIVVLVDGNTLEFKGEKARIVEMKIESAEKKKQTFTQDIRTDLNGRTFRININHILYMDKVEEGEETLNIQKGAPLNALLPPISAFHEEEETLNIQKDAPLNALLPSISASHEEEETLNIQKDVTLNTLLPSISASHEEEN